MLNGLLAERVAFVNVWLPIGNEPIEREPLAVCDWRSRPATLDDWQGEDVQHRAAHRWFFFSRMHAGQALVLKQWDSATSDSDVGLLSTSPPPPAREALHTAFALPETKG